MKTLPALVTRLLLCGMLSTACVTSSAQQLDAHFSCSSKGNDGEPLIYADNADMHIKDDRITAFHWESSLFRSTHGFDCSIDDADGLQAEVQTEANKPIWRVSLQNAAEARSRRGYDFSRGLNCTIRLERDGDTLNIKPTCPALCGSRTNFSELSVNLKTGNCRYEE
jgi:hypothetical protein